MGCFEFGATVSWTDAYDNIPASTDGDTEIGEDTDSQVTRSQVRTKTKNVFNW